MKKILPNLIVVVGMLFILTSTSKVYADCESNYGGGETCIYNKSFKVTKQVRIEGDDDWEDKITNVDPDDVIEFRIKITNVGEVEVDDMEYKDKLPSELVRVGGDGLTEDWDNFSEDESVTFKIKAQIDSDEFDRTDNFEKCVVNKVEVKYDGNFEGSDTATVCYGDADITELPETGAGTTVALVTFGLLLITFGTLTKKLVLK